MNPKVSKVIALMGDDVHRAPSMADLAASVNLSTSRLRHLFKDETGLTPGEYMRLLRLRKAADLLATTFLSVKEVMAKAGLTNQSHFVRLFKRVYGQTPTGYRAAQHRWGEASAQPGRPPR